MIPPKNRLISKLTGVDFRTGKGKAREHARIQNALQRDRLKKLKVGIKGPGSITLKRQSKEMLENKLAKTKEEDIPLDMIREMLPLTTEIDQDQLRFLYYYLVEGMQKGDAAEAVWRTLPRQTALFRADYLLSTTKFKEYMSMALHKEGVDINKIAQTVAAGLEATKTYVNKDSGVLEDSDEADHSTRERFAKLALQMHQGMEKKTSVKKDVTVTHKGKKHAEEVEDAMLVTLKQKYKKKDSTIRVSEIVTLEGEEAEETTNPQPNDDQGGIYETVSDDLEPYDGHGEGEEH